MLRCIDFEAIHHVCKDATFIGFRLSALVGVRLLDWLTRQSFLWFCNHRRSNHRQTIAKPSSPVCSDVDTNYPQHSFSHNDTKYASSTDTIWWSTRKQNMNKTCFRLNWFFRHVSVSSTYPCQSVRLSPVRYQGFLIEWIFHWIKYRQF